MENILYKCTECGWIGTESEMEADSAMFFGTNSLGDEEVWSNWICPKCGIWQDLEDYEIFQKD